MTKRLKNLAWKKTLATNRYKLPINASQDRIIRDGIIKNRDPTKKELKDRMSCTDKESKWELK